MRTHATLHRYVPDGIYSQDWGGVSENDDDELERTRARSAPCLLEHSRREGDSSDSWWSMTYMNAGSNDVRLIVQLLSELRALLVSQGEANWLRGINAALAELTSVDGELNADGFGNARSIYRTMTAGGRGFSEHFVWSEDEAKRLKENQQLDEFRTKLWKAFGL